MLTTINAKALAQYYQMGYSTFQQYLAPHRKEIREMATQRHCNKLNRSIVAQNYNSNQLKYIVEKVLGDCPEGFEFNGKTLIKSPSDSQQLETTFRSTQVFN